MDQFALRSDNAGRPEDFEQLTVQFSHLGKWNDGPIEAILLTPDAEQGVPPGQATMYEGGPKAAVIGAGSRFFGRQAIWQMVHSPHLNTGTLALVDTDPVRLRKLETLARMVVAETGVKLRVEASGDRRTVLCMCSGDTIGPGGVFRPDHRRNRDAIPQYWFGAGGSMRRGPRAH